MSNKTTVVSTPLLPLLTVLFVGLKLTGYIDWSWWWVLSPVLIPLAIVAVLVLPILGFAAYLAARK